MTPDALRLEVPDLLDETAAPLAEIQEQLNQAHLLPHGNGLQQVLALLFRLNRSAMTLLERQRALQSMSEEYRHFAGVYQQGGKPPPPLFVRLCGELAIGFKRLLLQVLQGHQPSRPHLAWCLYMAQYFLAQTLLRHYQLYLEAPPGLWRDSHQLYLLGERRDCLDDQVAAAFQPAPSNSLRGLYQQMLLLALSNPFHLAEGECLQLFGALAPLAGLGRLLPWDEEDEDSEAPVLDLGLAQPCLSVDQLPQSGAELLRRLELGALLLALEEPAPLQSASEQRLLLQARAHWMGRQQRRHPRTEHGGKCHLVIGLSDIHAQLLAQHPYQNPAQLLDSSAGGARLLCSVEQGRHILVGQLLLLLGDSPTPTLALVRWRHQGGDGLHLGLRYLKGLARPVWLRRAPNAQPHPGILQSTPAPGQGWHHGLWLSNGQFVEGENLWLQLPSVNSQTVVPLTPANLGSALVTRYPLRLG